MMISKSILDEFQKKDIKLDSKQVEFLNLVEVSIKRDKKILSFLRSKKNRQHLSVRQCGNWQNAPFKKHC